MTAEWMNDDVSDLVVLTRQDSFGGGEDHPLIRSRQLSTADLARYEGGRSADADAWSYNWESRPDTTNSVFVVDGTSHENADAWGVSGAAESVWLVGPMAQAEPIGGVATATEALSDRTGALGVEFAVFVPGDTWSVQDLVTLCHSLRASGDGGWSYSGTRAKCAFAAELPAGR